ncbi:DUF1482 family protein [Leclercia adecarboxylata]|uniref:DUF1482 family protein n=1 Tax=Leclercia adecarboxylata TaxID=83655 RepID=UPI003AF0B95F
MLALTLCFSSTDCTEAIKDVYATQSQCDQAIYEERLFNANCYKIDSDFHAANIKLISDSN